MKKLITLSTLCLFILSFSACEKDKGWGKKESKEDFYYSTDYKEAEGEILGFPIEEIDQLYSVFFYEHKVLKYKLVLENKESNNSSCFDKCDEVLAWEEGQALVDDAFNITFVPDKDPSAKYYGQFENEKKNYTVTLPSLETRELNFILK